MASTPPFPPATSGAVRPEPRRTRRGLLGVAFVLCFLAGLAVAGYAARHYGWFGADRRAASAAAPSAAPSARAVTPAPAAPDLSVLLAREAVLAGQLAAIEARAARAAADAGTAGDRAGRAEAVLTVAAARRAVDGGEPLGWVEDQLRARLSPVQPRAVALLIRAAHQPVTLDTLALELEALSPALLVQDASGDRLPDQLRRALGQMVVLRRAGPAPPDPAARLARARRLVAGGQVEAAAALVAGLPGAERAASWAACARRWVAAHRALNLLDRAALTLPPPAPAPPPAVDPLAPAV